jgi:urea carboxylase
VAALSQAEPEASVETIDIPQGTEVVEAPFGGTVWQIKVKLGDTVVNGQAVAVIEAMKTECAVTAAIDGIVSQIFVRERQSVMPGTPLLAIELAAGADKRDRV